MKILDRYEDETKEKEGTLLKMLRACVIECGEYVGVNSSIVGVVWTQLYGRMWYYKRYPLVSEFLEDVKRYATLPWYKSGGVLPRPRPSVHRIFWQENDVERVQDNDGVLEIYSVSSNRTHADRQIYSEEMDCIKEHRVWTVPTDIDIAEHYPRSFGKQCCMANKLFVVCLGSNILLYSEAKTNANDIRTILKSHDEEISCVAVSNDGNELASGDVGGNLKVCKYTDSGWMAWSLGSHGGMVFSIAISRGAHRVASVSKGSTICVWDSTFGKQEPTTLGGEAGQRVYCVSFLGDENCIMSGSIDGIVTVWSFTNSIWTPAHLHGHSHTVWCLSVCESGKMFASGSLDMTVRVWKEASGVWQTTAKLIHNSPVMQVAIMEKKNQVVSCCSDNRTVNVHQLGEKDWIVEHVNTYTGNINRVSLSNGGCRVASLMYDGSVVIWEWAGDKWCSIVLGKTVFMVADISLQDGG